MRLLFFGLLTCGVSLLAIAAFFGIVAQSVESGLEVESPDRQIASIPAGRVTEVQFKLRNATDHLIRVVGYESC
jgi:hypothetical protein